MTEQYEVWLNAERYIHNELTNAGHFFLKAAEQKIATGKTDGVFFDMMGALVFSAFAIEAKANFVGWKVQGAGWEERVDLETKINRLASTLGLPNNWDEPPLSVIKKLKGFRDTLAHGKPEIVNE